jgi:hypothetical protein
LTRFELLHDKKIRITFDGLFKLTLGIQFFFKMLQPHMTFMHFLNVQNTDLHKRFKSCLIAKELKCTECATQKTNEAARTQPI